MCKILSENENKLLQNYSIKLESLTGQKFNLKKESECNCCTTKKALNEAVERTVKKQFYGVAADFEREAKRVQKFYEANLAVHPELKSLQRRFNRLVKAADQVLLDTEAYFDSANGEKQDVSQLKLDLPIEEEENVIPTNESVITEDMGMTTADIAVSSTPIGIVKRK